MTELNKECGAVKDGLMCTMDVNHPGDHNGQGMSWPQVIWNENKPGRKCMDVYDTSPGGGFVCKLAPGHDGYHYGQGEWWVWREGKPIPRCKATIAGKGLCELVRGHERNHVSGGAMWPDAKNPRCESTYKKGELVPNPVQCELLDGHREYHTAKSIIWEDKEAIQPPTPRCPAQHYQPGQIKGCLLELNHEGDHKNGDLGWFNPRGLEKRPNQCKSELNKSARVYCCKLDVGHKGNHSDEQGTTWIRFVHDMTDGPCTSIYDTGQLKWTCQLGLYHPGFHQHLTMKWDDSVAGEVCGVLQTKGEDTLKCLEPKGHLGNHLNGMVWWPKHESNKTGHEKMAEALIRKHNMSLKLVELPTWKGKVVLYNDDYRWWMMVVDTTAVNVEKYQWEVFFDYKQLDIPHVRDMQEAIWNSLPDIDKDLETGLCAKAIAGAMALYGQGSDDPSWRYAGMSREDVIAEILSKGFVFPRMKN